jgi:hypothetical protein
LTIAAEIGQHLLQANQTLRHAYDDLLQSDTTRNDATNSPLLDRMSSMPNTPTKFQRKLFSPLAQSPKKHNSFNMSEYVESLEIKNLDLSQEIEVLTKRLSQSDRNNQKLVKDLEGCILEINALKQYMASSSTIKSPNKGGRELISDLRISYEQLEIEHTDLIEKSKLQEKELDRLFHQLEIRQSLQNEPLKALTSKPEASDIEYVDSETQTSKTALKSTMMQTVDKSLEKESLSFFKSLAFINSQECHMDFNPDQLFIPCRFPTSPQAITRSNTMHHDEWILEMQEDFSINQNTQSQRARQIPLLKLRSLMGQFVNYVYDLII